MMTYLWHEMHIYGAVLPVKGLHIHCAARQERRQANTGNNT